MTRIRFEDLPSTNTPRNAENLNKLNNVVISSTKPTTGEEVWIQKGKNLLSAPYTEENKVTHTASRDDHGIYTPYKCYLEAGQTYTMSFESDSNDDNVEMFLIGPGSGNNFQCDGTVKQRTFTINVAGYYTLRYDVNPLGATHSFWNFQVESGSKKTVFEPYIEKKIYTKNDNGVYEEFYNEENLEVYSTSEQRIGTWIDGKPLYRKGFIYGALETGAIAHNIPNVDHIHFGNGTGVRRTDGWFGYNFKFAENDQINFLVNKTHMYFENLSVTNLNEVIFVLEYTKTTD